MDGSDPTVLIVEAGQSMESGMRLCIYMILFGMIICHTFLPTDMAGLCLSREAFQLARELRRKF